MTDVTPANVSEVEQIIATIGQLILTNPALDSTESIMKVLVGVVGSLITTMESGSTSKLGMMLMFMKNLAQYFEAPAA
jgi:hypothetical protein